jgi:hypothetical protein
MDVDFGEGLSHDAGDSSTCLRSCQAGALAAFQAARRWCPLTQGIGLRPQPWARFSRPVGPATGFVRRSKHSRPWKEHLRQVSDTSPELVGRHD